MTKTWEEKIESLVTLAKVVGRYVNSESGTDYCIEAYDKLEEAYEAFCEWRHDEPYIVDEIKVMLPQSEEVQPPQKIMGRTVCASCGKFYEGPLSLGWYGYREHGQEWVFCCQEDMQLWLRYREKKE